MALVRNKGIDPTYYNKLAQAESSNNPYAKNKGKGQTASGLYQFTEGTWKDMVGKLGLNYSLDDRFDPIKSRNVVEAFTKQNASILQKNLGRELNETDLYAAHFLGAGGASWWLKRVNSDPNGNTGLSNEFINANKGVFYKKNGQLRTNIEVYDELNRRLNQKIAKSQVPNQENTSSVSIQIEEPKIPNIYTDVTNFGMTPQINTFVHQSQEDTTQQEESKKTEEEKAVEQKTNELNLIKDLYQGRIQQPQFQQEELQQQELPQLDVMQQYAEISNLLDQGREGGFFEGWAFNTMQQGGEIRESTLPNPINGIVREKYGRTKYDSRLDRIILTPSSDFANEQDVINHEKFHKLQFDQGRSNFDIAHQTENELWAKMQKRPSVTDTDEEYYKFHNRKGKEIAIDLSNLKESYPIMQFIPDDILYSKIIDTSQYYNPYSMEGEAQYYEDSFKKQQGGEIKTTPYGQWEFPGEITKIPSNEITMKDVPQALLGISNTGEKRIMLPEEEHTFQNATEVTEVPLSFKELYKLKTGKDLK